MSNVLDAAIADTVAYLSSEEMDATMGRNLYWPKWEGPWWRMLLLHELGLSDRIPTRAVRRLVNALNRECLRIFPLTESEIPPGIDPSLMVPCHCQLGTMASVIQACGVDVDREIGWLRAWFLKYQLPDGGLNCDEAAYLRSVPRSSMVSTVAAAEGVLAAMPDEREFLERVAAYLAKRRLACSLSKGMTVIDPAWYVPCFPRFYDYDVLRGLRFLARYSASSGAIFDVTEPIAHLRLDEPRWSFEGVSTLRFDASAREWQRRQPAGSFPLLAHVRATPAIGAAILRRDLDEAIGVLCPGSSPGAPRPFLA